jgi:thiamine biosynthesis lipoprotein
VGTLVNLWGFGPEKSVSEPPDPDRIARRLGTFGDRVVARIAFLGDAAMATSGDYRNYFENAGTFYSNTIDPRTGYPVSHNAAAVTVVADRAAFADGMATALLVLGPVDGLKIAERENIAALFQLRFNDAIDERMSTLFAREFVAK